jgi:hypothetical protein
MGNANDKIITEGFPVTMACFGKHFILDGKSIPADSAGDTWQSTWTAGGDMIYMNDDGSGIMPTTNAYHHNGLSVLKGTPEEPAGLTGYVLNPGIKGDSLINENMQYHGIYNGGKYSGYYSSDIYDIDGVLYYNLLYSRQVPGDWSFDFCSIMKSLDGGANWINHLGQVNTRLPIGVADSFFAHKDWGWVSFIKYGQGGKAPESGVDGSGRYIYLVAAVYQGIGLARIKREDMPSLDPAKVEYYCGPDGFQADGMNDAYWTADINAYTKIGPVDDRKQWTSCAIVYNEVLKRYITTSFHGDSFVRPPILCSLTMREAPHPWGPWTTLLEEHINDREDINFAWLFLTQKYTSRDGKKMWATVSGEDAKYKLNFIPVYLTTEPKTALSAHEAVSNGVALTKPFDGYAGSGCAGDFTVAGSYCEFVLDAPASGEYILNFAYHAPLRGATVALTLNGEYIDALKLGWCNQPALGNIMTDMSMMLTMAKGKNHLRFISREEDNRLGFYLESVSYALYAATAFFS